MGAAEPPSTSTRSVVTRFSPPLLRPGPDEARRLEEFESYSLRLGGPVLGLLLVAGAVAWTLAAEVPGRALSVVLLGCTAVPLAADLVVTVRTGERSRVLALLVLAPLAMLGLARWTGDVDLDLGWALLSFLLFMLVGQHIIFRPRRIALYATLGAWVILLLFAAADMRYNDAFAIQAVWQIGFVFTVSLAVAVRQATVAVIEAREAREALAREEAAADRRRIARDVHDVVAHTLAVTMLHITAARMAVRRSSPDEAEDALAEAERHGRASLADIRRIVHLLRTEGSDPAEASQPGLGDIAALVESYRSAGLPVDVDHEPVGEVSSGCGQAVYRLVQEALANAARHGSGAADVYVGTLGGDVVVGVSNPTAGVVSSSPRGSGLVGMRERVKAAGGTVEFGEESGYWVLRARVPMGTDGASPNGSH